jgi:hypothetical protein
MPKIFILRGTYFLCNDGTDRIENSASTVSPFLHVYQLLRSSDLVPMETCLESYCLAKAVSYNSTVLALIGHVTIFYFL